MAYIGAQIENRISPAFIKEDFTGNGSATTFTLTEVPANSTQIMVFVDGILQEVS